MLYENELKELQEQGLTLDTCKVVNEDGSVSYITEAVIEYKKAARAHIIGRMNQYIKEKNPKAKFRATTAMPALNMFCTKENAHQLVVVATPSAARLLAGMGIAVVLGGAAGAVSGPAAPMVSSGIGAGTSMVMSNKSCSELMEFVRANKAELEKFINKDWEHNVTIEKCLKANGQLPARIIIGFKKGKAEHESVEEATFDFW